MTTLRAATLAVPTPLAQLASRYDGNYLSHDAFRKLGRYYMTGTSLVLGRRSARTS